MWKNGESKTKVQSDKFFQCTEALSKRSENHANTAYNSRK